MFVAVLQAYSFLSSVEMLVTIGWVCSWKLLPWVAVSDTSTVAHNQNISAGASINCRVSILRPRWTYDCY